MSNHDPSDGREDFVARAVESTRRRQEKRRKKIEALLDTVRYKTKPPEEPKGAEGAEEETCLSTQ